MATGHGFVYVLGNESMPGIYKIGHTKFHPAIRAAQLSSSTGCPTEFVVLAYFASEDAFLDEIAMHEDLSKYRVNGRREFFNASPDLILAACQKHSFFPHEATFFRALSNIVALANCEGDYI